MENQKSHQDSLQACIEACEEAVHASQACAAADIKEGGSANCALINLDCADICSATMNALARGSQHHGDFCALCAHICTVCAQACPGQGPGNSSLCIEVEDVLFR